MDIMYKRKEEEIIIAIISKGFRPMLIMNERYSNIKELIEYLDEAEYMAYDEYNITNMDSKELEVFLYTENSKNKYRKALIESDEEIDNIGLKTLEVITEQYYIDEFGFLWIKK